MTLERLRPSCRSGGTRQKRWSRSGEPGEINATIRHQVEAQTMAGGERIEPSPPFLVLLAKGVAQIRIGREHPRRVGLRNPTAATRHELPDVVAQRRLVARMQPAILVEAPDRRSRR